MTASSRARGPLMLAVWLAVTAAAVTVSWFGIDSVVGAQAVTSPQLFTPVDPTGPAGSPAPDGGRSDGGAGRALAHPIPTTPLAPVATATPGTGATSSPAAPHTPPPAAAQGSPSSGRPRRFSMTGGAVVVQIDGDDVAFVSATPSAGYRMQDWIETPQEWLRVDFTESADANVVYSFFITWNGYSPQWTEAGPNWTQTGSS